MNSEDLCYVAVFAEHEQHNKYALNAKRKIKYKRIL